jgi:WD40 repeat protein
VNALAVSPDGRTLASADVDQSISFWDMPTGKLKARIHEGVGWVKTLAFSPDGRRIAFGGRDCTVQLRELEELGLVAGSNRS